MKTVTLKTDDSFFDKLTELAKELHLTKSELIRRSVTKYEHHIRRKKLKERFKAASVRVRESNREAVELFEDRLNDGLENV